MNRRSSPPARHTLLAGAVGINLVWALSYPLSKDLMQTIDPLGLTCWRIFGALPLLLLTLRKADFPSKWRAWDILLLFAMGVIGVAMSTLLQFVATKRTLASNISLLVSLETPVVVLLGWLLLKERTNLKVLGSILVAFAGVVLITVDPNEVDLFSGHLFIGNVIMVCSVVCYSLYTVIGKVLSARWGATALTTLPFLFASSLLLPWVWATRPESLGLTAMDWGNFLPKIFIISTIGTGLGYWIWNWLLQWMTAGELSRSLYVQPVAGVIFSYLLLGEQLSTLAIIGSALVIAGIYLSEKASGTKPVTT